MAEEDKFDEMKNTIKIYRKEYEERAKSILERINKVPKMTESELFMEYSAIFEKITDFMDMMGKLIHAQDGYIKELEKIVDRMR